MLTITFGHLEHLLLCQILPRESLHLVLVLDATTPEVVSDNLAINLACFLLWPRLLYSPIT